MSEINVKTSSKVIPMCYAYSTPEIAKHDGWVKVGYTEKQDVDYRNVKYRCPVNVVNNNGDIKDLENDIRIIINSSLPV